MTERETPHVILEPGALTRVGAELSAMGFRRPFIISSSRRSLHAGELHALLGESVTGSFLGAAEHVPIEITDAAERAVRAARPDVLIAIGGGSPIGLGKALVLRVDVALAAIPTTYSGSEMTSIYGFTDSSGKKTGRDARVLPRIVFYDPLLTLRLPAEVTAASGMNALAHSVEAAYAADATTITTQWAEDSIRILCENLPRVVADPANIATRTETLYGAHLAGRSLSATTMGLHHRMCHVLGGSFGLPHARTHAVLLPYVAHFNRSRFALQIEELARQLPLPRTLGEIGFRKSDMEKAAIEVADAHYPSTLPLRVPDVIEILEQAFEGT